MTPTERARLQTEAREAAVRCATRGYDADDAGLFSRLVDALDLDAADRLAEAEKALRAIRELAELKKKDTLPAGTRDDRCRRQGMDFAYDLVAKIARAYFASHQPDGETHG